MAEVERVSESPPGWSLYGSWLHSFPKGTQWTYKSRALAWFRWLQDQCMKPQRLEEARAQGSIEWLRSQMPAQTWDGLVQLQKAAVGDERYAILDLVEYFVNHVLVATYGHKGGVVDTVRSFFSWNRAELPSDPDHCNFGRAGDQPSG